MRCDFPEARPRLSKSRPRLTASDVADAGGETEHGPGLARPLVLRARAVWPGGGAVPRPVAVQPTETTWKPVSGTGNSGETPPPQSLPQSSSSFHRDRHQPSVGHPRLPHRWRRRSPSWALCPQGSHWKLSSTLRAGDTVEVEIGSRAAATRKPRGPPPPPRALKGQRGRADPAPCMFPGDTLHDPTLLFSLVSGPFLPMSSSAPTNSFGSFSPSRLGKGFLHPEHSCPQNSPHPGECLSIVRS